MGARKEVANMKIGKIIALLLAVSLLTGCSGAPSQVPPVPKETPEPIIFETAAVGAEAQTVQTSERFTNADSTMEYTFNINQEITPAEWSVIEAIHYMATGEDARRLAEVMMPGKEFYKLRPHVAELSKIELQEKIDFYSQFATKEALEELYRVDYPENLEMINYYIDLYTDQLKNAPEKEKPSCDWKLYYEREHFNLPEEIGNRPLWEDDYCLYVVTTLHDCEMILHTWQTGRADEPYSTLGISRNAGRGEFLDQVLRSRMLRTQAPTEEQIQALMAKAESLLNQLDLGQWKVVESEVEAEKIGDVTEYMVLLNAVPVVNGVLGMLHNNSSSHQTMAHLQFSANGELYYIDIFCPIIEKADVSDQVHILPMDKVLEKAREHLKSQTLMGTGKETRCKALEQEHGEKIVYKTEITDLEIRLGKMEMPETHNRYFYVPFVGFRGTSGFVGADSGTWYEGDEEAHTLFWVYTFDGRIIPEN